MVMFPLCIIWNCTDRMVVVLALLMVVECC